MYPRRRKPALHRLSKKIVALPRNISSPALVRAEIVAAKLENSVATITVAFESEQTSFTKNAAGEVISGNTTVSERLYDTWVFERHLNNRNPVWLLTDTDATE